jgi:Domain of unknown function (DUF1707)
VAYGPAQAFPPQPPVPEGSVPFGAGVSGVNPAWLASSADRERAVGVLRAGFTEGRLTQDELDERVAQAYAARTYGQLWALTADLPAGGLPYPQFPQPHGALIPAEAPAPPSHWKPAAALIITALVIFTLAALITAVITAHTQAVVYPGFQQPAHLTPFIRPLPLSPPNNLHVFPTNGLGS